MLQMSKISIIPSINCMKYLVRVLAFAFTSIASAGSLLSLFLFLLDAVFFWTALGLCNVKSMTSISQILPAIIIVMPQLDGRTIFAL